MSEPTPADVLREAARLIRTSGWCTGTYDSADGRHCALGAIYAVRSQCRPWELSQVQAEAREVLKHHLGVLRIPAWNDEVAIDGEDVAVHMEKAAIRWEETAGLND